MEDIVRYLSVFNDPPGIDDHSAAARTWWDKACDQYSAMGQKWNNHPLMLQLGPALFEYIEIKAKVKSGKKVALD